MEPAPMDDEDKGEKHSEKRPKASVTAKHGSTSVAQDRGSAFQRGNVAKKNPAEKKRAVQRLKAALQPAMSRSRQVVQRLKAVKKEPGSQNQSVKHGDVKKGMENECWEPGSQKQAVKRGDVVKKAATSYQLRKEKVHRRHVEQEIKILSEIANYRSISQAPWARVLKSGLPDGYKIGTEVDVLQEEAEVWA
ncbi:hypothetical protein AK812_SmicGene5883 [Symbiodinium microadriaticum]|uniref:Uncharacterized protein n=1 Tax=Symbiodinium microadriaticum TaxID=2951 RepID=A0A1Q9ESI4_SYMMI|nr:hypothetical protein AK812_SmicGene5883 [Symbiodinium microadriaticum]